MTELDLLDAIIASPDDLSLRLVAADWYEERGDPRGEFIRVQCRLAEANCGPEESRGLVDRADRLHSEFAREWDRPLHRLLTAAGLPGQVGPAPLPIRGWTYSRGFVESITLQASTFIEHHSVLPQLGPLRNVVLFDVEEVSPLLLRNAIAASDVLEVSVQSNDRELVGRLEVMTPSPTSVEPPLSTNAEQVEAIADPIRPPPRLAWAPTPQTDENDYRDPPFMHSPAMMWALFLVMPILVGTLVAILGHPWHRSRESPRVPSPEVESFEASLHLTSRDVVAVVEAEPGTLNTSTIAIIRSWWLDDSRAASRGDILSYHVTFFQIEGRYNGRPVRSTPRKWSLR